MVRIALVEDDANYRQELTEYLNRFSQECGEHFAISTFSDGAEVAEGYTADFDIILMDIAMAYMDGMSAAEAIRRDVPVLKAAEDAGFGDYSVFLRAFRAAYGKSPREWK